MRVSMSPGNYEQLSPRSRGHEVQPRRLAAGQAPPPLQIIKKAEIFTLLRVKLGSDQPARAEMILLCVQSDSESNKLQHLCCYLKPHLCLCGTTLWAFHYKDNKAAIYLVGKWSCYFYNQQHQQSNTDANSSIFAVSSPTLLIPAALQTFDLLVELLHAVANGLGETFHDVAHHAEVCHVVNVSFLWRWGNRLQLILISIFHTWRERREKTEWSDCQQRWHERRWK